MTGCSLCGRQTQNARHPAEDHAQPLAERRLQHLLRRDHRSLGEERVALDGVAQRVRVADGRSDVDGLQRVGGAWSG